MCVFWLVEDCIISFYNHPAQGGYNTEALIFNMAAVRFPVVPEEDTNKMKENAVSLIINHLCNYTKTIILFWLSKYCQIIPSTLSLGLLDNIHFAFGEME